MLLPFANNGRADVGALLAKFFIAAACFSRRCALLMSLAETLWVRIKACKASRRGISLIKGASISTELVDEGTLGRARELRLDEAWPSGYIRAERSPFRQPM